MKIEINLTNHEVTCLNHDVLDIQAWVEQMVAGKINNCRDRILHGGIPKMFADTSLGSIPASAEEIVAVIVARDDYKTREERGALELLATPAPEPEED